METIDFNGDGRWSVAEVRARYAQYAAAARIVPRDLSPDEHGERERRWIYPIMNQVIEGIEAGDPACTTIGIEFIEEDRSFRFGRILKANTARALRRTMLSPAQKRRILRRVFAMLEKGYTPREYRQYARLARSIGFSAHEVPAVDFSKPYLARYHAFFMDAASPGK